ncbi:MAG TPA: cytochrome c [Blastocatellia bacterium]|nr:cytochrome c [Blastocatellia bacterium]
MARGKKIVGIVFSTIVAVVVMGISFTIGWRPFIGPKGRPLTARTFERTAERLERGKYLVEGVLGCFDCHSERDWNQPGAPVIEAQRGGGALFAGGPPGRLIASNISPDPETGAGTWSDDAFARAIREGIGHDGRALFPIMPWPNYAQMSDEDLAAVIAYVRSTPPVPNALPKTQLDFPVNYLMRINPEPIAAPVPAPDLSDPVKRGAHLARMGSCADCHTPQDQGQPKPGLDFAGGFILIEPSGEVASANITPDPSGISYYDEALFIEAIRTGQVKARKLRPRMPWLIYRNMSDEDLKAIFAYLRTLKPVKHAVDNAEPPTQCKLCGSMHGFGDRN